MVKFHQRNQGRTSTAHTVEKAHHLGHCRHLYFLRGQCSNHTTDGDAAEYPTVVVKVVTGIIAVQKDSAENGQCHACCRNKVSFSCRLRMRKHLQTNDERN